MDPLQKNSDEFQRVFGNVLPLLQSPGNDITDEVLRLINVDPRLRADVNAYYQSVLYMEPRPNDATYPYQSAPIDTNVGVGDAGTFRIEGPTANVPIHIGSVNIAANYFASAVKFVTTLSHELAHFAQRNVDFFVGANTAQEYADAYLQREALSHLRQAETAEAIQNAGSTLPPEEKLEPEVSFLQQERARITESNPTASPEVVQTLLVSSFASRLSAPDSGPLSRLLEAMKEAATRQPLAYTADGQIYGVTVGKDTDGNPRFEYERGDILVEGTVAVNGMCRIFDADKLQSTTTVTPAHKLIVETFDTSSNQLWSEQTERFDAQRNLESTVTVFDDGSQTVAGFGNLVQFGLSNTGDVVAVRVDQLNGAPVEQVRGEAIARSIQAYGGTPDMVATDSPWLHGVLDANNLGLHQADLPPTTFTMPPAVLFEGLLDGESSTVEQLNQALTPAAGSASIRI